jgi:hypothetical protein
MEKKPLTLKQKIQIYNIGRIIACAVLIFGIMMNGLADPLTWIGLVLAVALAIFRVVAIRCPECDELIPSSFGVMAKTCDKCGWHINKENEPKDENT